MITCEVNNMSNDVCEFVVARVCDGELWYWGSWENEDHAKAAAREIDGIVVRCVDE